MFYVNNENDINDLFREAANRYPLKIENASGWKKVSAALRVESLKSSADVEYSNKEKKRLLYFWWLFLLPLGWFNLGSWQKLNAGKVKISGVKKQSNQILAVQALSDISNKTRLSKTDDPAINLKSSPFDAGKIKWISKIENQNIEAKEKSENLPKTPEIKSANINATIHNHKQKLELE